MDEKYQSLKKKLDEESTYPLKYMYKFIVPKDKVQEVLPYFETADISTKKSKTGKYVSISATIIAFNSEEIIARYESIKHIEGMISL